MLEVIEVAVVSLLAGGYAEARSLLLSLFLFPASEPQDERIATKVLHPSARIIKPIHRAVPKVLPPLRIARPIIIATLPAPPPPRSPSHPPGPPAPSSSSP